MKPHEILLTVFLLIVVSTISAQTIISGIVTDSLNKPIPFANVYLMKTTIGATTGSDGKYSFKAPQDGHYQLLASCVGFHSNGQFLDIDGNPIIINIKLSVNYFKLSEVIIKASHKFRKEYYKDFVKLFIGKTPNAKYCKILNPEDLYIDREPKTGILKGFSINPLKITNKALGYTVIYHLKEFKYNPKRRNLKFAGDYYFMESEGSSRKIKQWNNNRLKAYKGSIMHFLRAFYSDSLQKEGFRYSETTVPEKISLNNSHSKERTNRLVINKNKISKTCSPRHKLVVTYEPPKEIAGVHNGYNPYVYCSIATFTDYVKIYKNGMFEPPFAINWSGPIAVNRVADLLPFDYIPGIYKGNSNISEIESFQSELKDQVFVQTDRNLYYPGDTIYFQAYIRDKISNEFVTKSKSLYALLFNEQNELVDSSRFRIDNFTSLGFMIVPTAAKPGKYRFVAFTSLMQNENPEDAFKLDLKVYLSDEDQLNASIELNKEVYKPGDTIVAKVKIVNLKKQRITKLNLSSTLKIDNSAIETDKSQTDDKGESTIRFVIPDEISSSAQLELVMNKYSNPVVKKFKIPLQNKFVNLSLLPEGGTLVEGIWQRIGFNATNDVGETVDIKGLLKTQSAQTVDTIKSGIYGPGLFICRPQKGMYIELINGSYKNKIWPLPEFSSSDKCLRVRHINSCSLVVEVQAAIYKGDTVFLSGNLNSNEIFTKQLVLDKMNRIILNTDSMPSGVMQVSLMDSYKRPIAERLLYVNAINHLKFEISSDTSTYNPGQEAKLNINVTDGQGNPEAGIFSIAVTQAATGYDTELFSPGIEYTFNYHPYFAKNLPPKVLSEGIENLSDEQRDLLLMVYGWSKYNLDFKSLDSDDKQMKYYDLLKIKILTLLKSKRSFKDLMLLELNNLNMKQLLSNEKGEILFSIDSLKNNTTSVILMNKKNDKGVKAVSLAITSNPEYFKSKKHFNNLPVITEESIKSNPNNNDFLLGDSIIAIPLVTIKSQAKTVYNDVYNELYPTSVSIANEELWKFNSLEYVIKYLAHPHLVNNPANMNIVKLKSDIPALIVLDDNRLGINEWLSVKGLLPCELKSVTIINDPDQGYAAYGSEGAGGVIFINTMAFNRDIKIAQRYNNWLRKNNKNILFAPIEIYRANKEYYNPTKVELDKNPILHNRPTVYWEGNVYFDGKGPVTINYPNLNRPGQINVVVNGVSSDNLVGTGKFSYQVKNP